MDGLGLGKGLSVGIIEGSDVGGCVTLGPSDGFDDGLGLG